MSFQEEEEEEDGSSVITLGKLQPLNQFPKKERESEVLPKSKSDEG